MPEGIFFVITGGTLLGSRGRSQESVKYPILSLTNFAPGNLGVGREPWRWSLMLHCLYADVL